MFENIIELREKLVGLSKDPVETRKLLDQLTEAEVDKVATESHFHVGKNDIEETKDFEFYKIHKCKTGYLLHYHGGYSVFVDNKLLTPASCLQQLMDGVPEDVTEKEDRENWEMLLSATEMVFRMPMFVLSNLDVTLATATCGLRYLVYLQEKGEVPTPDVENPEFDKAMMQINEFAENLAKGLEKEGKEYEKRMGYGTESVTVESEGEGKDEGQAEA